MPQNATGYVIGYPKRTCTLEQEGADVDPGNSIPVSLYSPGGTQIFSGIYGEQVSGELIDNVSVKFIYGASVYDITTTTANGGTVTDSGSLLSVSSGTATNGSAIAESINAVRYSPGHTAVAQFTAAFESQGVAGATQFCGVIDSDDGLFLGFNGVDRVVGYRKDSVDTFIEGADWNGDARAKNYNWDSINLFRIVYGWLGAAPVLWQVFLPETLEWVTLHAQRFHGNISDVYITNPSMPIGIRVTKTSGATDIVVKSGSWQGGVIGNQSPAGERPFSDEQVATSVDDTATLVAAYRNVSTFQGLSNKVRALLRRYHLFVDSPSGGGGGTKSGTMRFRLLVNPVLGGTPNYQSIDSDNSVIEVDTAQTYTSGGVVGLTEWVGYSSANQSTGTGSVTIPNAEQMSLFLDPGNVYAVVADRVDGVGTPNVRISFNWCEQQ